MESTTPPKKRMPLGRDPALFSFKVLSIFLAERRSPYKMNQDVKKIYEINEIANNTNKMIIIMIMTGIEIIINPISVNGENFLISFFDINDNKYKNIKNAR